MPNKKKRRAPIEQLRQAGKIAQEMLIAKGIQAKSSILTEILANKDAPPLPGIPNYLPHKWTLMAANHMMYDILVLWQDKCREQSSSAYRENVTEFFKFFMAELRKQEQDINKEITGLPKLMSMMKDVPILKDVFSPMQKKDTLKAMQRFFVDSFAVAIVLKSNTSTGQFVNWFLDWTQQLHTLWLTEEQRKEFKPV